MTQKLNEEPWLLCDEQRFISGEISHQTKKRGLRLQQKEFFVGEKNSPKFAIFRGEKGQKSPYLDYRSFASHEHIAPNWVSRKNWKFLSDL